MGLMRWAGYVARMVLVIISYRTLAGNPGGLRELTNWEGGESFIMKLMLKVQGVGKEAGSSWLKQGAMA